MLTRIEEIHDEGLAAIDAAASTEQLEELRVRLLGRKAELPNLLRGVGELEPAQRGQVGKRANEVRKALEARLSDAVDRLDASELDAKLVTDRVDVTLPGDPLQPVGRLHLITQTWREIEDVFVGLGFTVMEGNEVETVHYNFDALNHGPTHPARGKSRHVLRHRRHRAAHAHLADAGARDGGPSAAAVCRHPRARVPARQRRDAHPAVPPS